jgi:dihydrofolate reductase
MYEMIMIAAMDEDNTIAIEGEGIPWDIEEDLQQYLDKTRDKPLLLGRKTFESTRQKMNKTTVVLTRDEDYTIEQENIHVANSKEEAEEILSTVDEPVYNLGGAQIYDLFIDTADTLIISHIDGEYNASEPSQEKKFPEISMEDWNIEDVEMYDEFQLVTYTET